jgi:protoheme IX farnesyltransferase
MALIDDRHIDDAPFRMSEATPGDYIALLKPRVMSLVVFTAVVGLVAAPGSMNPLLAIIAILAIAIGAGASGALNMWYDADIDKIRFRPVGSPPARRSASASCSRCCR